MIIAKEENSATNLKLHQIGIILLMVFVDQIVTLVVVKDITITPTQYALIHNLTIQLMLIVQLIAKPFKLLITNHVLMNLIFITSHRKSHSYH